MKFMLTWRVIANGPTFGPQSAKRDVLPYRRPSPASEAAPPVVEAERSFNSDDRCPLHERGRALRFTARKPKWPWRDFLTDEESGILAAADKAKKEWSRLNGEPASITNRAIQRAKCAALDSQEKKE